MWGHLPVEVTRADFQQTDSLGTLIIEDAETAHMEAEEIAETSPLCYFTDGSRNDRRRAGAACVRIVNGNKSNARRIRVPMGRGKEAFDAELMAILAALKDAGNRQDDNLLPPTIHVVVDSQAALKRIQTVGYGSGQPIVHSIHQWERRLIYQADDLEIKYHWVPAHKGAWGNEEADQAAKQAAEMPDNMVAPENRYLSLANMSRLISEYTTKARGEFIQAKGGRKFEWNKKLAMNSTLRDTPKRDAQVFWQFSCGHALTGDYLKHKIKKTDDDTCWHCNGGQPQTRSHLIERCAAFKEERKELRANIRKVFQKEAQKDKKKKPRWKGRAPVREMFAKECLTEAVLEFLKATKIGRTGRPPDV